MTDLTTTETDRPTEIKTPYRALVPPLSAEEKEVLSADIESNGQLVEAITDEDGNLLDDHHRYDLLGPDLRTRVVSGLSEPQKKAYVVRMAVNRRSLSSSQLAEIRKQQREIAVALRQEDPNRWGSTNRRCQIGSQDESLQPIWNSIIVVTVPTHA